MTKGMLSTNKLVGVVCVSIRTRDNQVIEETLGEVFSEIREALSDKSEFFEFEIDEKKLQIII